MALQVVKPGAPFVFFQISFGGFTMNKSVEEIKRKGLYDASFEHDNCGIGAIIH